MKANVLEQPQASSSVTAEAKRLSERSPSRAAAQTGLFRFIPSRKRAAVTCTEWCTPGMGVSVGVQVPCRRFTFMYRKIPEDNYESKARASPRGGV